MTHSRRQRIPGHLGAALALVFLFGATLQPAPSEASSGGSTARIRVPDPTAEWPLQRAIEGAHEWLGNPSCQQIFSDFTDLSGTPLSQVLDERDLTGQGQLGRLAFWDGSHREQCRGRGVSALTVPGHHIVYVCPSRFRSLSRDPVRARAVVVHEMLHSLGMGENPPTSREITDQILERCQT